ncbi:oligosaccharide flippase family protein [Aliiroseovarius sp. S1339]|uniref:oligosaccharide flippase family protein n=1 Tax=Aliiroseovarius sp. S1339 TaxID=2936990 RepID=UPI0020BDA6B1|nr:oligosaccharide flippase family protein [Aliiroseovarius sp. S1339]MCK8465069.1 oligosaccharide flippase family protein [Aliiroseovarius sp. S1339]
MVKTAFLVLSGNAFSSFVLLLRNLLVARLMDVEDYGIAATFALSMAVVEMMSTFGLHQLIVQNEKGDDPDLQAGLQGFHLLRGVLSALALIALAHPIARFLGIDELAWAYQVLAVIPVLRGFIHFDVYRLSRAMNFGPLIASTLLPALVSTLLVWPTFLLLGDFRVMLVAYVVQWGGMTVASHLISQRKYRLVLDRGTMGLALRFGWPLLINNAFLLLVYQGEKLVVGRELGMVSLAILAMGFTLTLTPTLVIARSLQSFFLPQLSAAVEDRERFRHLSITALQFGMLGGLMLVVAVDLAGKPVVTFLLGTKYAALLPLLSFLAVLQSVRLFKVGCTTVALALGHTANAMIGNLFRVLSIPISWYVAATGGELLTILWIALLSEVIGYFVTLALALYRASISPRPMILPVILTVVMMVIVVFRDSLLPGHVVHPGWVGLGIVMLAGLIFATMGDLIAYYRNGTVSRWST